MTADVFLHIDTGVVLTGDVDTTGHCLNQSEMNEGVSCLL